MIGIYIITSPTNKVYVGQSWNITKRLNSYKNLGCKAQHHIYSSLKKYGWEAHNFEITLELRNDISQEWMNYWEVFIWRHYKDQGYEMLNIKEPGSNGKHSEESKQKMRESLKGRFSDPTKHPNLGKKFSIELRKKLSDSHKGKVSPKKGVKASEQERLRLASVRPVMRDGNHPKNRSVIQYTLEGKFVREWDYIKQPQNELGFNASNITRSCRNPHRSSNGFKWEYKSGTVCQ